MRLLFFAVCALFLAGCHAQSVKTAQNNVKPALKTFTPPFVDSNPHTLPIDIKPAVTLPDFNGDNAYALLKKQCAFGVRVPNSKAHEQCKQFISDELKQSADTVVQMPFTFHDKDRKVTLKLTNILATFGPKNAKKIMLFTHYDTRPTADQELLDADKKKPIPGADDGASGTAVLLELAHVLKKTPPNVRVELLFVDGEDWGPTEDKMYLGSVEFANHPGQYKPAEAVLLDMIGDKDLQVFRETYSETYAKDLNDRIWAAASALGYGSSFPNEAKWSISDDHLPFNRAGIPAVDLIDFDYPYWHTAGDTPDKCSAASLKIVGDVCAKFLADAR